MRNNLAIAVRILGGDPAEELALLEQAVAVNPRDEQAWINLVVAYRARYDLEPLGRGSRALRALELSPDDAPFRFNLAIIELIRGNFADSWLSHKARWQSSSELRGGHPALNAPCWHGESLESVYI
ncbi:MAG: hypothetical protein VB142_07210 [Burkholderia sp.]